MDTRDTEVRPAAMIPRAVYDEISKQVKHAVRRSKGRVYIGEYYDTEKEESYHVYIAVEKHKS